MVNIGIVIPQYGKEEYTKACINAVKMGYGTGEPIEILVVDDGSEIEFKDHTINVLRLEKNTGCTNALNQGILWFKDRMDYILLLNNDTVPENEFLKKLVDIMESDETIGIASSCRYYPTSEVYELYGLDLIRGYQAVTKTPKDEVISCNWVPLCACLLRMDMVREIGLLDKRMINHSSDLDYCLRAKLAGWNIVVDTSSVVLHHHEVTTKANNITPEKDQKVMLEKLAGLQYAELMKIMPLDAENGTYGQLKFEVYKR